MVIRLVWDYLRSSQLQLRLFQQSFLVLQVLDNMSLSLRDLHPGHRTVLEAGSAVEEEFEMFAYFLC